MVQVIYLFKEDKYPYGKDKQSPNTYMQYVLVTKNSQQAERYRELSTIFKKINSLNIMKLLKVLKQEQKFHMLYEYQNKSLQVRLKELQNQEQLANIFVELENVFQTLIHQRLKAQIYLEFMGVDEKDHLKVWIKPNDVQYIKDQSQKINKQLLDYYQTQRTRIHLEIEQIFEAKQSKHKEQLQEKHKQQQNTKSQQTAKHNNPNFVIEGNTLVFINQPQKNKSNLSNDSEENSIKAKTTNKFSILTNDQRPMSKIQNGKKQLSKTNASQKFAVQKQKAHIQMKQPPVISKMSIAQKVLYYKKLKQNPNQNLSGDNVLIVKDSSTSNASINDISKSSNNDSNIQIKTQMINKHKMKITTSQQVEVEGNSDDDLQKLARQKIAQIQKQRHDRSHNNNRSHNHAQNEEKGPNLTNSGNHQKLLKQLEETAPENKNPQKIQVQSKQINSKIVQAKQKARDLLQKYGQKFKK